MALFPSSSGYAGIEATPLARIGYSDFILSRVYEEDWLPRITSSELLEPVTKCNQVARQDDDIGIGGIELQGFGIGDVELGGKMHLLTDGTAIR